MLTKIMEQWVNRVFIVAGFLLVQACSASRYAETAAMKNIIRDSAFLSAHTGICLYDPAGKKFIYRYQDDKYFIPASNTKIISCYAGMKFLGDSIPGIRYAENDTAIFLVPTGDPTFLHPDFREQPVADFIRNSHKKLYMTTGGWNDEPWGMGWSWDDYAESYMPERSPFPVYGNVVRWYQVRTRKENPLTPSDTTDIFIYSDPEWDGKVEFGKPAADGKFGVLRSRNENAFTLIEGREKMAEADVPFITDGIGTALKMVGDSLHREILPYVGKLPPAITAGLQTIYSRPLDSMLAPMMHRSDNFFAEQTLLMAGNILTRELRTPSAISKILTGELNGYPDPPRWADGSGLSRYNLFSPRDFVWILDRMRNSFSWERITAILPTGGTGTLGSAYGRDSARIFAKTGTLSGVAALSGYLITRKNKVLIFSIMINNHRQPASLLRSKMAAFLHDCIEKY